MITVNDTKCLRGDGNALRQGWACAYTALHLLTAVGYYIRKYVN